MDLREEESVGVDPATHWYYVSKGHAIRELIGQQSVLSILDVGAGSGVFVRHLIRAGYGRRATCIDPGYTHERTEEIDGCPVEFVREGAYRGEDLVLFIDVLEHVEDDAGLLRKYTAGLTPGASVLISVPAFQFLWSGHDVFLKHKRRYNVQQLKRTVLNAGLRVENTRFFFAGIFPIAVVARLIDRLLLGRGARRPQSSLRAHGRFANQAVARLHDLERKTLFRINRLFGLTIFCLARRG